MFPSRVVMSSWVLSSLGGPPETGRRGGDSGTGILFMTSVQVHGPWESVNTVVILNMDQPTSGQR